MYWLSLTERLARQKILWYEDKLADIDISCPMTMP